MFLNLRQYLPELQLYKSYRRKVKLMERRESYSEYKYFIEHLEYTIRDDKNLLLFGLKNNTAKDDKEMKKIIVNLFSHKNSKIKKDFTYYIK